MEYVFVGETALLCAEIKIKGNAILCISFFYVQNYIKGESITITSKIVKNTIIKNENDYHFV